MKSQCDGIECGAFGRYLGHKGEGLMNGISALIKEALENLLVLSTTKGQKEKAPGINQEEGAH